MRWPSGQDVGVGVLDPAANALASSDSWSATTTASFTSVFDELFADNGTGSSQPRSAHPGRTPSRSGNVGTLRRECLDHLLITANATSGRSWATTRGITTSTDRTSGGNKRPPLHEPRHAIDMTARITHRQAVRGLINEYRSGLASASKQQLGARCASSGTVHHHHARHSRRRLRRRLPAHWPRPCPSRRRPAGPRTHAAPRAGP